MSHCNVARLTEAAAQTVDVTLTELPESSISSPALRPPHLGNLYSVSVCSHGAVIFHAIDILRETVELLIGSSVTLRYTDTVVMTLTQNPRKHHFLQRISYSISGNLYSVYVCSYSMMDRYLAKEM